jgi:hypothetical protein
MEVPAEGVIMAEFEGLQQVRNKYRDRAREYAKVTLPYLLPETEQTDSNEFQNDYNTEGAKLVNALANRYTETLFPAGRSFVKLDLTEEQYSMQEQAGQSKADIMTTFARIERDFRVKFGEIQARATILDAMKHLIVTGNALLHLPQEGNLMNYAIDEYVVLRDLSGKVLKIITEDKKAVMSLPEDIRSAVIAGMDIDADADLTQINVSLFTYIRRDPDNPEQWLVDQAVESIPVGEQNIYNDQTLRWFPVIWNRTRREMYGRGLVEEHFGSFWTMSILSEALAVGAVTLADIKFLVRPGSMVDVARMNASASGTYHYGDPDDINAVTSDKNRDMMMIQDVIEAYKRHLGEVFMYLPSTMRDAERVTAEENRLRARELESGHGGVYSMLADGLQKPLAILIFNQMGISDLESSGVEIVISAGLNALSRGAENDKINHWMSDLSQTNNVPPDVRQRIKMSDFLQVTAAGRDVDFSKFIMNENEFQQAMAQAQQQQTQAMGQQELMKKADPEQLAGALQQ